VKGEGTKATAEREGDTPWKVAMETAVHSCPHCSRKTIVEKSTRGNPAGERTREGFDARGIWEKPAGTKIERKKGSERGLVLGGYKPRNETKGTKKRRSLGSRGWSRAQL